MAKIIIILHNSWIILFTVDTSGIHHLRVRKVNDDDDDVLRNGIEWITFFVVGMQFSFLVGAATGFDPLEVEREKNPDGSNFISMDETRR
jgi:hypothetical protein